MKKILFPLFFLLLSFQFVMADEGMWLLTMLNKTYPQMKAEGFKLSPDDIYNINKASLKDAVVIFGGFCTGEIVSDQGLVFTNHHCGYGAIQDHSSVEHDYLTDGFWAQTLQEELPNPGLFVLFLVRMDDVTADVLKGVKDNMSETERDTVIQRNIRKIQSNAKKSFDESLSYTAMVRSFFENNQYFLIIYQKYDDVRLVGAPPTSIGKFGGDTDNWMWTRHTGDFSIFRVYMSPDGKPAKYSAYNVPLKPKYVIPVSIKGQKEGDYAQIMGFPGRTNRYASTYAIDQTMNITNKDRAKIRGIRQEILWKDMLADQEVYIKYAAKYAQSSNYWKYSIGQNQGLRRLEVLKKKKEIENNFSKWINTDPKLEAKYGNVLDQFKSIYAQNKDYVNADVYIRECLISGSEYIGFAYRTKKVYELLKANNTADLAKEIKKLQAISDDFFKDYNAPTDKKSSLAMLNLFVEDMESRFYPDFIKKAQTDFGSFDKYIDNLFNTSIFITKERFDQFLANPKLETLQNDPGFVEAVSVFDKRKSITDIIKTNSDKLDASNRLWMEGLMKMQPNKVFYPDANFTMRYTYGTVGGYAPKDAVVYKYFTTLKGVMEKEDPENPDFVVSEKLKSLYENQDYGQYADADGSMHVCFLTNNDITGGNSGSPVFNGNAELIGLAFDGNWEAMSGDIAFEPELQRTICVDVRYVLFIIDKLGNDKRLIDELKIVK